MSQAPATFTQIRSATSPALRPIVDCLRQRITALDPAAVEVVWVRQGIASFGVGPRKMTQHYAYIGVHLAHVNLGFYHGHGLRDPEGLLEGTGKKLRHVKIASLSAAKRPALERLLVQAITDRRRVACDM